MDLMGLHRGLQFRRSPVAGYAWSRPAMVHHAVGHRGPSI